MEDEGGARDPVERAREVRKRVMRTLEEVRAADGDSATAAKADAAGEDGAGPADDGAGAGGEVGALLARTRAVIARTRAVIEHTREMVGRSHREEHSSKAGADTSAASSIDEREKGARAKRRQP